MRLLLLEVDKVLGDGMAKCLRAEGHGVDWLERLGDISAGRELTYDMLLLPARLPDGSGLEWIRSLRDASLSVPILFLAAEGQPDDRIRGIEAGADDCLVKPFGPPELLDRVRLLGIRAQAPIPARVQLGNVQLDLTFKTAYRDGEPVMLTAREWSLVEALAQRSDQIVPKSDLEALVHGPDALLASNALEVHLWSVRRKLGRDLIRTVRGIGYRLRD